MQDIHSNTHTFSEADKLKAFMIVNIFETSRPMGDYAAVAVLDDGAGVSYGMAQFTHRSGSLAAVVDAYLETNCPVGRDVLVEMRPLLGQRNEVAISRLAGRSRFKNALRSTAVTAEMKAAQIETAFRLYLKPAIEICEKRGFTTPLSLAVVYDGIVHGSFDVIARKTTGDTEKAWIMSYVRRRHLWLTNVARLKKTSYRTRFFLNQIAIGNWELKLPLNVNGYRLEQLPSANRQNPLRQQGALKPPLRRRPWATTLTLSRRPLHLLTQAVLPCLPQLSNSTALTALSAASFTAPTGRNRSGRPSAARSGRPGGQYSASSLDCLAKSGSSLR